MWCEFKKPQKDLALSTPIQHRVAASKSKPTRTAIYLIVNQIAVHAGEIYSGVSSDRAEAMSYVVGLISH